MKSLVQNVSTEDTIFEIVSFLIPKKHLVQFQYSFYTGRDHVMYSVEKKY